MSESNGTGALAKALLAAQKEMPAVDRDGRNPHFKSAFTTLGHLLAKARPVINKHGIAVSQFPSADPEGNPTLVTILMHESGEREEYAAPLFLPKNDPQGQGSAITYMRRYALASALGISDQDDDDGNAGSGQHGDSMRALEGGATPAQKRAITTIFNQAGVSKDMQAKIVHGLAGDPPSKQGASEVLDVLKGESDLNIDQRIDSLIEKAGLSTSEVPADLSNLPPEDDGGTTLEARAEPVDHHKA